MSPFFIPSVSFLLLVSLMITNALPLQSTALTSEDLDVLKLLLSQLEESVPAQMLEPEEEEAVVEEKEVVPQPEVLARNFLSARDLKTVRQNSSSKKYSGCFGGRLDRIDSMSTLGCNTVGRHSLKRK
ncbi:natriuretic peptides B isoform X2 [Ictalurus punctatus]|uniref:Natriuretic peptides B isoform X2 n=1 Tax=Ictalurus punctatus TaxID=7998 RepID=A0A2D0QWB0_ICTPU|nr:natriuretic peptides B isoform X2 [Ictalurus punctatus]